MSSKQEIFNENSKKINKLVNLYNEYTSLLDYYQSNPFDQFGCISEYIRVIERRSECLFNEINKLLDENMNIFKS